MQWPSGLEHSICVLMAESKNVGSNPNRDHGAYMYVLEQGHFTIIASLHPGVNGYL